MPYNFVAESFHTKKLKLKNKVVFVELLLDG